MISLYLILLILLAPAWLYAADIFVHSSCTGNPTTGYDPGTGSLNGGSYDCYSTVDGGDNAASAGDTVHVQVGTYNESVTISSSGSAGGGYITLRQYDNDAAIITNGSPAIFGRDISYYKVIGLEITNNGTGGGIQFSGTGSHLEIRNNNIHDSQTGVVGHSILITATDENWGNVNWAQNTIQHVIIDGNTITNVDNGTDPSFNEALTIAFDVKYFQITNNTLNGFSHIGINHIGKTDAFFETYACGCGNGTSGDSIPRLSRSCRLCCKKVSKRSLIILLPEIAWDRARTKATSSWVS